MMALTTIATRNPALIAVAILVSACTSNDVRDTATITGALASSTRAQLDEYKKTHDRVAVIESRRLANFERDLKIDEAAIELELGAMDLARNPNHRLYQQLRSYSAKVAEAGRLLDTEAISQALLASRTELAVPSKKLKAIAEQLAVLGRKESVKDRIQFIVNYAKTINKYVDEARAAKEKLLSEAEQQAEQ